MIYPQRLCIKENIVSFFVFFFTFLIFLSIETEKLVCLSVFSPNKSKLLALNLFA